MPLVEMFSTLGNPFTEHKIIPDVIPDPSFSPSVLLSVQWPKPNNKKCSLGNTLSVDDTREEPEILFTPIAIPDSTGQLVSDNLTAEITYTLVFVDPDAPSKADPRYRQFRHWVVTGLNASPDISGKAFDLTAVKAKKVVTPYRPPGPGPGSGTHRYVFLLFEEPNSTFNIPPGSPEYGSTLEERRSWNAAEFGKKYGLKLVGANFFLLNAAD